MPKEIEMRGEDGPAIQGLAQGVSPSSQLAFLRSAYEAAETASRVADEKIGYLLLFLGILIATISVRGDIILSLLTGQQYGPLARGLFFVGCLVFLGPEGISLVYAARGRRLAVETPTDVPGALAHLAALETAGLAEELARALHQAASIADRKLTLLRVCLGWAALAFLGWWWILIMSVAF